MENKKHTIRLLRQEQCLASMEEALKSSEFLINKIKEYLDATDQQQRRAVIQQLKASLRQRNLPFQPF